MTESTVPNVSLSAGSEAVFDIVCQPCSSDGTNVDAEFYCRDCHEHLRGQCIEHHKKFSSMKHHQLVDKDALSGPQDDLQVRDVCTERCPDHREEVTKCFCPDHKTLACGVCVTIKHKRCDDMDYIQDVAAGLEDLQDYKDFTANMGGLKQKSKDTVTLTLESKQRSLDCHTKVIAELDVYRDELVDAVDRGIQEMRDQAGQILAQDTERMDKLAAMGNQALAELQSVEVDFQSLLTKKHLCKLFVDMKRKEETFTKLQENIEGMGDAEAGVTTYTFQPNEELRATVGSQDGIGKLVTSSENNINRASVVTPRNIEQIKATHVADINVKSSANDETCALNGMAMISKDKVVVADFGNSSIKLISTENNTIISEVATEYCPWDVTVCNDKVAATLPGNNAILFLKQDGGLVYDSDINVDGSCRGIDWFDDKLYVVFDDEKKLEVMTTTGTVLQRFITTGMIEQLFEEPEYGAVSAVNKRIYVSDFDKGQLIMLDMTGKRTGVYEANELSGPRQLAVARSGVVFLCDFVKNTVHLLSPGGDVAKILLTSEDGMASPESVCYCEDTRRLYVAQNTVISELATEVSPWDVTVCKDTVAATLPKVNKIVFLKHDGGRVHDSEIRVDGDCRDIDWYDDKLYATCDGDDGAEVTVVTTTVVVLQRFTTTDTGEQLFNSPRCVSVSAATTKRIYVSDWGGDRVTVLDSVGKQTGVYDKDDELCGPTQMAVTNTGVLFLCDYGSNTVHVLSPGGEVGKILLTSEDGLTSPCSVCYCEDTCRLYVGMYKWDYVKVYELS